MDFPKTFPAAIIAVLLLSGCTDSNFPPMADESAATPESIAQVVSGNNEFAFELYSKLREKHGNENVLFSPYSISTALAIAHEGAAGTTSEQMLGTLNLPEDGMARNSSFASIYNSLNRKGKQYELYTANALWAQKDYPFSEEYVALVKKYFGASAQNLDFINEAEKSAQAINSWAEKNTNGKIKQIVSKDMLSGIRLVITNSVYFKGQWATQFDKSKTKEEDFETSPGNKIKVQMMSTGEGEQKYKYAETEDLQAIELPYKGKELSMFILLPKENDIAGLENSLTEEKFSDIKESMYETEIPVKIPRFKFDADYSLGDDLQQMGMQEAFLDSANFSVMDTLKGLKIGFVVHKAVIEVNEEGTEAAAVTAVGMMTTSVREPLIFRADHPFVFVIQDNKTGSILFIGKIIDPTK